MNDLRSLIRRLALVTTAAAVVALMAAWVLGNYRVAAFSQPLEQGQGQGNDHWKRGQGHDRQGEDEDEGRNSDRVREGRHYHVALLFSVHDREVITGYYRHEREGLPPGLAKRGGNLPPGLERHLERDGQLPPGLQKRLTPLPPDLDRRLPRLPTIYVRGTIGADVVIMNSRTGRIVDILRNVVRER